MTLSARLIALSFCTFWQWHFCLGQGSQPVLWEFKSEAVGNCEVILKFTASVAQGWHLYSQHINEGGPIPTQFSFEHNDDYILMGQTEEKGEQVKFHDDIYDMEITWYTGTVSFLQKVRLSPQAAFIKGTIEFMICNDHTCIPSKQNFNVDIRSKKKTS